MDHLKQYLPNFQKTAPKKRHKTQNSNFSSPKTSPFNAFIQQTKSSKSKWKDLIKKDVSQAQYRYQHDKMLQQQARMGYQQAQTDQVQKFNYFQPKKTQYNYMGKQLQLKMNKAGQQQNKRKDMQLTSAYIEAQKQILNTRNNSYFDPYPFTRYKIIPASQERMCLDVVTKNDKQRGLIKGNLIIWHYHGGPNQHFYFKKLNNGNFNIISASTGFFLEVGDARKSDNSLLIMSPQSGFPSQQFFVQRCGRNLYMIRTFCDKVLDINHQWLRNGVPVQQFKDHNGKNQKWRIQPC